MFQTIIGQEQVVKLLKNDIIKKSLSNSIIFHGENSTGKLSTALEFARVINCNANAEVNCQCSNCIRIHELNFPGLVLLSRRNFNGQINEYFHSYITKNDVYYLKRAKKLIKLSFMPLDDNLIKDCFTETDKNVILDTGEKISKLLDKEKFSSSDCESIIETMKKLYDIYKRQNIPIDMMRNMLSWTYISQPDVNRVIIIDHFDYMEESTRNVLLKRLEEPSPNLYFIILAENKNRIIETIRSRCRPYYFRNLTKDHVTKILKIKFGEETVYNSVNEFLGRSDEYSITNIYSKITKLLNLSFRKEHNFSELSVFLQAFNDRKLVKSMLQYIENILEKELLQREVGSTIDEDIKIVRKISSINLTGMIKLVKDKYNKIDKFNLNPVLTLEGIFYPLKAMVQNDQI